MKCQLEENMQNFIEIQYHNENEFKDEYEQILSLYNKQFGLKEQFEEKFL